MGSAAGEHGAKGDDSGRVAAVSGGQEGGKPAVAGEVDGEVAQGAGSDVDALGAQGGDLGAGGAGAGARGDESAGVDDALPRHGLGVEAGGRVGGQVPHAEADLARALGWTARPERWMDGWTSLVNTRGEVSAVGGLDGAGPAVGRTRGGGEAAGDSRAPTSTAMCPYEVTLPRGISWTAAQTAWKKASASSERGMAGRRVREAEGRREGGGEGGVKGANEWRGEEGEMSGEATDE